MSEKIAGVIIEKRTASLNQRGVKVFSEVLQIFIFKKSLGKFMAVFLMNHEQLKTGKNPQLFLERSRGKFSHS